MKREITKLSTDVTVELTVEDIYCQIAQKVVNSIIMIYPLQGAGRDLHTFKEHPLVKKLAWTLRKQYPGVLVVHAWRQVCN